MFLLPSLTLPQGSRSQSLVYKICASNQHLIRLCVLRYTHPPLIQALQATKLGLLPLPPHLPIGFQQNVHNIRIEKPNPTLPLWQTIPEPLHYHFVFPTTTLLYHSNSYKMDNLKHYVQKTRFLQWHPGTISLPWSNST